MKKKIKVVVVEPMKQAYVKEINTDLDSIYDTLKCDIFTAFYPYSDKTVFVIDDEGKLNGSLPNRAVMDSNGKIVDIIFGTFFICDASKADFDSLSPKLIEKYLDIYKYPEAFYQDENNFTRFKLIF